MNLNLAATIPMTAAEGPGQRFAIWVQGCPLRCPGCCNPHYLEFRPARSVRLDEILAEVLAMGGRIEGITLIGGEPFSQAAPLAWLAEACRTRGLSVMTFSGHTWEDLLDPHHEDHAARSALLSYTDLLVAGPYLASRQSRSRRWIGSENQTIHFLSDRYTPLQKAWPPRGNTIELRLNAGGISINGFPHRDITRLNRNEATTSSQSHE